MAEELTEFNAKTKTQDNLFEELKKMDQNKQLPQGKGTEDDEASEVLNKRRAILKGVKQQIDRDEA